jgi:WD40 repeat protein
MVYNGITFDLVNKFQAHSKIINRIKQSPVCNDLNETRYVATCSDDATIKIWNPSSNWTLIQTYSNHKSYVYGLEWINEDTIASGGAYFNDDGTIHLWSIITGKTKRTLHAGMGVFSLNSLQNGIHLAAAGLQNGDIKIYNFNTGDLAFILRGHTSSVRDLLLFNSSNMLVSSSYLDVRVWDLATNACKFVLNEHTSEVYALKQVSHEVSLVDPKIIRLTCGM